MSDLTYCELEPLNKEFNNKPLYRCSICGLTIGLENPEAKILCFKKMDSLHTKINQLNGLDNLVQPKHYDSEEQIKKDILEDILNNKHTDHNMTMTDPANQINEDSTNLCSEQEIESRLEICNKCEHYKDNSCLLCGCVIVRESNYKNKLAHKDQKCPIDKWGPIT